LHEIARCRRRARRGEAGRASLAPAMHARHGRAVFQGIPKVGAGAGADFRYASVSIVISVRYYAVDEMCELATIPTDLETSGTSVGALGGQSLGARRGSISALSPYGSGRRAGGRSCAEEARLEHSVHVEHGRRTMARWVGEAMPVGL
jgi:hypothetical protein